MAGGGILQRRVDELESVVKKLDEERRLLKQENASLVRERERENTGDEGGVVYCTGASTTEQWNLRTRDTLGLIVLSIVERLSLSRW